MKIEKAKNVYGKVLGNHITSPILQFDLEKTAMLIFYKIKIREATEL